MKRGKLSDLVVLQRGFDITKANQTPGSIPIISSSGPSSFHNQAKCQGPGVITGRKGTLGKVFYSEGSYWPHDTTLWGKDFKGNHPKYVYFFLKLLKLETYDAGASNPTLNRNHVHKIDINIPAPKIQRKIAVLLSAYDDLIKNNNRRIALLEKMGEELYREWFVRLRFPGHESTKIVKGVPEGWAISKIGECFVTSSGGTPSRQVNSYYNGEIDWIKTGELKDSFVLNAEEKITDAGLKNSSAKIFPSNTLLMAMYGVNIGKLGICIKPSATNQACCAFLPLHSEEIPTYHLFHYMKILREHLFNISMGAAQQNLSQDLIRRIPYIFPSHGIIQKFEKIQSSLFDKIRTTTIVNVKLATTRDRLLTRLMSGKIDLEALDITFPPSMQEAA